MFTTQKGSVVMAVLAVLSLVERTSHIFMLNSTVVVLIQKKKKIVIKLSGRPGSISCFHKKKKKTYCNQTGAIKIPFASFCNA